MSTTAIAATIQREPELLGQTVVVIGGSTGIGLETTRSRSTDGVLDVKLSVPDLSKTSGPLDPGTGSHVHESNWTETRKEIMVLLTSFGHRRAMPLMIVILLVAMTWVPAHSQHSHSGSQVASDLQAWSDLRQSMLAMHGAMASIQSTGNDDEDFVRLMLPHHQAALDMAKVELMHGQDPQMRRLAQEIIADQESEIDLMQLWLRRNHARNPQAASSAVKEQSHEIH